jgi:tetratricopeptide (TPR) repeat protein
MKIGIILPAAALAAFFTSASPALAQRDTLPDQPRPDVGKMDDSIKSYQDAVKYYKAGQLQLAKQELEKFLGKVGQHAGGNFLMGMVQAQLGDLPKAKIFFTDAVKYDPKMVSAHGWLGAVDAATGDPAGAQTQRAALAQMQTECAGKCPKAADIQQELDRIDQNIAASKKPS